MKEGYLQSWRVWLRCDGVKDRCKQLIHALNQRLMLRPPAEIRVSVNKRGQMFPMRRTMRSGKHLFKGQWRQLGVTYDPGTSGKPL